MKKSFSAQNLFHLGYFDPNQYGEFLFNIDGTQFGNPPETTQCIAMQYIPDNPPTVGSTAFANGNCLATYPFFCEQAQNSSLQLRMQVFFFPNILFISK
jgi:hypothetical protein